MSARCTISVEIANRLGLHARPAMELVDTAARFSSTITIARADRPEEEVDGKSIMQVMMLAATRGTELKICADGADAEDACRALKRLVESGFNED